MKKITLLFLALFGITLVMSGCKKDDDPTPPPVVGKWVLDKIVLSEFPAPYERINTNWVPSVFGFESNYELTTDKKFSYRVSDGINIEDGDGTWEYTGTTLKLKADDGSEVEYTYNEAKKELSSPVSNVILPLENPDTEVAEDVPGKWQHIYRKQ